MISSTIVVLGRVNRKVPQRKKKKVKGPLFRVDNLTLLSKSIYFIIFTPKFLMIYEE